MLVHLVPHLHLLVNSKQFGKHGLATVRCLQPLIGRVDDVLELITCNQITIVALFLFFSMISVASSLVVVGEEVDTFVEEWLGLHFANLESLWADSEVVFEE